MQQALSEQPGLSPPVVPKDPMVEQGEEFLSLCDKVGAEVPRDFW